MKELIKQAEQDDARVQFRLGMAYYKGIGVEIDVEEAFKWWMKAANHGVEAAYYCLGCILFKRKDYQSANKYYLKAIQNPLINEAGFWLGIIYEYGLGVEKNIEKAVEYYKKGAAGLNLSSFVSTDALKRLGVIHSWADLGISHQELCENAQYRFNESWNHLIHPLPLLHSNIWLKMHLKE